jgi:hypothetical protein
MKDYELSQPDVEKTDALFNELEFRRMAEQFDTIFKKGTTDNTTTTTDDSKLYKSHRLKTKISLIYLVVLLRNRTATTINSITIL